MVDFYYKRYLVGFLPELTQWINFLKIVKLPDISVGSHTMTMAN